MKKVFLATLLALWGFFGANAQVVYEDFEGGSSDLAWAAPDGTYNGVVANPGPDAVNNSAFVGSYTKAAGFGYSLFWVPSVPPVDLTQFNQFKLKVYSSAATKVLLKLEGTGQAIEKTDSMPAANQWVELTFDLSGGEYLNNLTKIIIFFDPGNDPSSNTYYFDDLVAVKAPQDIETFETPSGITWSSINGAFNGAVANPDPDAVNSSATVGSFSNNAAFDYNFAKGVLSAPLDLSTYNQFKVKLWAPKPTQLLFKLEGGGDNIERTRNIAVTNRWQEYTFDLSGGAGFDGLNTILMVFSPGVTGSTDTFYIDDIQALPQGACSGYTPDPEIIDDFDCNRNAAYRGDFDSLEVVKNPFPNIDNPSRRVGKYKDVAGNGTEYAALVIDYENPIDLSVRNQFSLKMYAPKTGTLLLKIEGGSSPKEVGVPVTEINKWVEYSVDFSGEAGEGHKALVIFFNAGVNGAPGDVYYIDDIKLAAPKETTLENFQNALPNLGWQPLGQNEVAHGSFSGPVPNPNPNSVNNSTQVGCYSKGASTLSTLQGINVTGNFDLGLLPQFNIDVLSPAAVTAGTVVRMQLSSPTEGNKTVEDQITTPGQWETLNFDFSAYTSITDFSEVRIIFNPDVAAAGQSWCIDNLRQGLVTADPCAGVTPNPVIIDNFECQRNYDVIFYGANDLKVVNNPYSQTTENPSLKVGQYTDPAGAGTGYEGIGFRFPAPPDLSINNQLEVQVYSPSDNVPFLFKIQGNGANVEKRDTLPEKNKWYTFSIDFSSAIGTTGNELVIFFNEASPTGGGVYYVDNIRWRRTGYNGCVSDYESSLNSIANFTYFNNNPLDGKTIEVVDNPVKAGINTSSKVARYVQSATAPIFSGAYADLDAPIDFKGVKEMRIKVLMDHLDTFTMKVEVFGNPIPPFEIDRPNTKVNEWEELVFPFPLVGDNDKYTRLTILIDKGDTGTGTDVVTYFDDIVIGTGQCSTVGTFTPTVAAMRVVPNPATDRLRVENPEGVERLEVLNAFGQRVSTVLASYGSITEIQVAQLPAGLYTLTGYDRDGRLMANAKFVKQ